MDLKPGQPPPADPRAAGATGRGSDSLSETSIGLASNIAAALSYAPCCVGLALSIVVVVMERQSRFLRFHALQSLLCHAVLAVLWIALAILTHALAFTSASTATLVHFHLDRLTFLAALAATIFLMVKAYGGEEFEIPALGQMARQWV
jgi:uncharacterized membrane protein